MIRRTVTYVIHALNGYEVQAEHIRSLFKSNELDFTFITDGDPSLFTEEGIAKYFSPAIYQKLRPGVLSCTYNHMFAYQAFLESGEDYGLVFENDVYFTRDFQANCSELLKEADGLEPGFIISIENSTLRFPSFWQTSKAKRLYRASSGRMAGAYIIDKAGAKAIMQDLETTKCDTVIDWWHQDLIDRGIVRMYWAHPTLTEQGSHNGKMSSTISTKSQNGIRRFKWLAQRFYHTSIGRLFNEKRILRE